MFVYMTGISNASASLTELTTDCVFLLSGLQLAYVSVFDSTVVIYSPGNNLFSKYLAVNTVKIKSVEFFPLGFLTNHAAVSATSFLQIQYISYFVLLTLMI